MTVIVGVAQEGKVFIGGDSASVSGYQVEPILDKVFKNNGYLFGTAGSIRMKQLLHYSLVPPKPVGDLDRFMAIDFINAIRKCLKDGGHATLDKNEEAFNGAFLVGVNGILFRVSNDFQVVPYRKLNYTAVGAGDNFAIGSLHSTSKFDFSGSDKVRLALQAATQFSGAVCAPFKIMSI